MHQDADGTQPLFDFGDDPGRLVLAGEISQHAEGLGLVSVGNVGGGLREGGPFAILGGALFPQTMNGDPAAQGGEPLGERPPQTASRAGHQCRLSLQQPLRHRRHPVRLNRPQRGLR